MAAAVRIKTAIRWRREESAMEEIRKDVGRGLIKPDPPAINDSKELAAAADQPVIAVRGAHD
jgi:hypothetical protein